MKQIMIISMVLVVAVLSLSSTNLEAEDLYKIEQLTPNIFRIIALKGARDVGYGDALAEGIKSLSSRYHVEEITPIAYGRGYPYYDSFTKELLIRVTPK